MKEKTAKKILEKVKNDYSAISAEFNNTRKNEWKEFEIFKPYIKENDYIIDVGCGNGRLYPFLKKHKNIRYLGVDNNKKLIDCAKTEHNGKFIIGDLLNIPIDIGTADVVTCIAALHHIPSYELKLNALSQLNKILKKDGILILSVWNLFQKKYKKYIWKSRFKWLISLGKYQPRDTFIPWGKTGVLRYYYAFQPKEIKEMLEKKGFEILKMEVKRNIVIICQKRKTV